MFNAIEKHGGKILIPIVPALLSFVDTFFDFGSLSLQTRVILILYGVIGYAYLRVPNNARKWKDADCPVYDPVKQMIIVLRTFAVLVLVGGAGIIFVVQSAIPNLVPSFEEALSSIPQDISGEQAENILVAEKGDSEQEWAVTMGGEQVYRLKVTALDQKKDTGGSKGPMFYLSKDKVYLVPTSSVILHVKDHYIAPNTLILGWVMTFITAIFVVLIYFGEVVGDVNRKTYITTHVASD